VACLKEKVDPNEAAAAAIERDGIMIG